MSDAVRWLEVLLRPLQILQRCPASYEAEGAAAAAVEHRSGLLVPGGVVERQRRDDDSPERPTGVGRGWSSPEKKELTAELEIRYKAGKIEITG